MGRVRLYEKPKSSMKVFMQIMVVIAIILVIVVVMLMIEDKKTSSGKGRNSTMIIPCDLRTFV
jgi:uncharacterized membrane protein